MEKGNQHNIKRIVLIGPESTGKTEITEFLAKHFNTYYVPEYARGYIEQLNRSYEYRDVEHIALKQVKLQQDKIKKANSLLFYDTYLVITKVWFDIVFNKRPAWLDNEIKSSQIDLFLLCNTDLPWVPDLVRENGGEMREKLFRIYQKELENYGFNYEIVTGKGEERFSNALRIVTNFLENK